MIGIPTILFLLGLVSPQTGSCGLGCLRCSTSNTCALCDFLALLFVSKDTCSKGTINNCSQFSPDGVCKVCNKDYYLNGLDCTKVPDTNLVVNCETYGQDLGCSSCKIHFILLNAKCVAVSSVITNCTQYSTDGLYCLNCGSQMPDLSLKKCTSIPNEFFNCRAYSYLSCNTCKDGYIRDYNYFLADYFNRSDSSSTVKFVKDMVAGNPLAATRLCRKIVVENCAIPLTFNKCKVCKPYYYLTKDAKCNMMPEERIENCEEYESSTICKICKQGFVLSENFCQPVTIIPNCKTYATSRDALCLECSSGYYLSLNECIKRINTVPNCLKNLLNADLCDTCNSGYVASTDRANCLKGVTNCKLHTINGNSTVCSICSDGYYLNDNVCEKGSLDGCLEYSSSQNCKSCQAGYYLDSSNICKKHQLPSVLCQAFSSTQQNLCQECLNYRALFTLKNICLKVTTSIENCVSYSGPSTCSSCSSSTSYLKNNACVLGTVNKCTKYSPKDNICLACIIDQVTKMGLIVNELSVDNKCVYANPNLYNNCGEIASSDEKECSMCKTGFYMRKLNSVNTQFCVPETYYELGSSSKSSLCQIYNFYVGECLTCKKTDQGRYYVLNDGACVETCPPNFPIQTFIFVENRVSKKFVCRSMTNFQNAKFMMLNSIPCLRYDVNYNTNDLLCVECPAGAIASYKISYSGQYATRFSYLLTTSIFSYYSSKNRITPTTSCLNATAINSLSVNPTSATGTKILKPLTADVTANPSLDNCRFIVESEEGSGKYFCSACKFGYTGKIVATEDSSNYMIEKCEILTSCKRDIWINGAGGGPNQLSATLAAPIDYYLTCHKCTTSSPQTIPTYGISLTQVEFVKPFLMALRIGPFGLPSSASTMEPYKVDSANFITQTSCQYGGIYPSTNRFFPANCAIQMLRIDTALRVYLAGPEVETLVNPVCMACEAGYQAKYSTVLNYAVVSCTKIKNCVASNEFNVCEECAGGFARSKKSEIGECVESSVTNCLVWDTDANNCDQCTKGSILNSDGLCDTVKPYECKTEGVGYYKDTTTLSDSLMYGFDGIGCTSCNDKFVAVSFREPQKICIESYVLSSGSTSYSSVFLISNCNNYGLDELGNVVCIACQSGYTLTANRGSCEMSTIEENCLVLQNDGYYCQKCKNGFYYDYATSSCRTGAIDKCLVYTDEANCFKCEEGFIAVSLRSAKTICFAIDVTFCSTLDPVDALGGSINCLECSTGYYASTDSSIGVFPLAMCLNIPKIENCVRYSKKYWVKDSTLYCEECSDGYYLSTKTTCQKRTITVLSCAKMAVTREGCETCNRGFYLDAAKTGCKSNPTGIVGCVEFTDNDKCTKCSTGKYLRDDACLTVPAENLINNCRYYRDAIECDICGKDYVLNKNVCEQALASNCLTYKDKFTCLTCPDGYGLVVSSAITSCSLIQISNCEIPDLSSIGPNFKCLRCSKGFYLDKGQCKVVNSASLVTNCLYYKTDGICMYCKDQMVLNSNGTKCTNMTWNSDIDSNCLDPALAYRCSACKVGFYFNGTSCVKCEQNYYDTGCEYCNPDEQGKTCAVCMTGYKQDSSRICDGVNVTIDNKPNIANQTQSNGTVIGEKIHFTVVGLVILFGFFLF